MGRGAPLSVLDDETPLNGPDIDVGVRVGWVLRTARLMPGPQRVATLHQMAQRLGTSIARLHRLETGLQRDGSLVDGYERVLDRPAGSLRAPIDVLCRTFPRVSPRDRDRASRVTTAAALSDLTDLVIDDRPDGGLWLTWCRALAEPGAIGMPARVARPLVRQLASELGRSVGPGYPSRYEALALVRTSGYGHLVLEAAREVVTDPDVQVLYDLMSAVGEAITDDATAWCLELLASGDDRRRIGAVLALENMAEISPDKSFLGALATPVVDLLNAAEAGSDAEQWLSHLFRLLPSAQRSHHRGRLTRPPAPAARIPDWSRTRLNAHWTASESAAAVITAALTLPEQPVLARLIFDIAFSPRESRAVTSYMLLAALPHLARPVGEHLAHLAEHHEDPVVRARVARRLPGTLHGVLPDLARGWLHGQDVSLRNQALLLAGAAGEQVSEQLLEAALAEGGSSLHAAMYAAGMTSSPLLTRLAHRDCASPRVAGAARWWLREGSRVDA